MLKYEELKAKDLAREAIALEPSKTLYDTRNILLRYNISRVVIAKDNKPLGIITEKDIARFLYKEVPNRLEISVKHYLDFSGNQELHQAKSGSRLILSLVLPR